MSSWLFQGNPDVFDIDQYLQRNKVILWSVRQKHYAQKMEVGDTVFLWRAAGSKKLVPGIVAVATILEPPAVQPDDAAARGLWIKDGSTGPELRVRLAVSKACLGAKEVVRKDWLEDDPIVGDLTILRMANSTNYELPPRHAQRLRNLVDNTGRTWGRQECLAALWAYKETYGKEVSRLPGSSVAEVALAIGRAVSGVYNKVMNYRSIDPRDSRKGLSSINKVDQETWDEFYDPHSGALRVEALDKEYRELWGHQGVPSHLSRIKYEGFGEAPDDDPSKLAEFAAKVRKGQPKFRKNLLRLYNNRCAISGDGPETVLEAAHITRHSKTGINHTDNGILLRADLHSLFDAGLLRIDPSNLRVVLDQSLKDTSYWTFNDRQLLSRTDGKRPSSDRLKERWEEGTND